MAKYTTEVRSICETLAGYDEQQGFGKVEEIIEAAAPKIFSDFPIFNEDYRLPLEVKILRHYYTREISDETVGLWMLRLDVRMNDIMPYYNQLYNSELLEFNPFYDTDLTTHHNRDTDGNVEGTDTRDSNTQTEENSDSWNKYSDTPQGGIDGLEADTYLTNASHNTGTDTVNTDYTTEGANTEKSKTIEDFWETIVGKKGTSSYSQMLEEYRKTFLNIDMMIIEDLKDLFFNLW